MKGVNIHDAKMNLSRYLAELSPGETLVICNRTPRRSNTLPGAFSFMTGRTFLSGLYARRAALCHWTSMRNPLSKRASCQTSTGIRLTGC